MSALNSIIAKNIIELNASDFMSTEYEHGVLVKPIAANNIGHNSVLDEYLSNKYVIIEKINDISRLNNIKNSKIEIKNFNIRATDVEYFKYDDKTNTISEQNDKFIFTNKSGSTIVINSYYINWGINWCIIGNDVIGIKLADAYMGNIDKIDFKYSAKYANGDDDFKKAVNIILV